MEDLVIEHKEKFGVEPVIIGLQWDDREELLDKIEEAIESGKPYSEYDELTDEEKKAYDAGELEF